MYSMKVQFSSIQFTRFLLWDSVRLHFILHCVSMKSSPFYFYITFPIVNQFKQYLAET